MGSLPRDLDYAEKHGIPIGWRQAGRLPLFDGCQPAASSEGRHLENPAAGPKSRWRWTVSPEAAPDAADTWTSRFRPGRRRVAITATKMQSRTARQAQRTGRQARHRPPRPGGEPLRRHEESRLLRDPGGTILLRAHRAIESITLDREVPAHLSDGLTPRYASTIYNGYWVEPWRRAIQALIDHTQQTVNGQVRLKLYKGHVIVTGRDSKTDLLSTRRSPPSRTMPAPTTRRTRTASSPQRAAHAHRGQR